MTDPIVPLGARPIGEEENKAMLLSMLRHIHAFCEEHGIRYFLYFGSLLGAVRHRGFIPWDDDIDICMTRREYEKFIALFPHDRSSRYRVSTVSDPGHYTPYAKVIDNTTLNIERKDKPTGLYIDLFIIDGEGKTLSAAKRFLHLTGLLVEMKTATTNPEKTVGCTRFRRVAFAALHPLLSLIGETRWLRLIDRVSASRSRKNQTTFAGSVNASAYNERQILRGEWFEEAVLLDFEGEKFYAPAKYHEVLTTIYVTYWQLPPESDRISHHSDSSKWILPDDGQSPAEK